MTVSAEAVSCYFFGDCKVDVVSGCLIRAGLERRLRYQSFQILLYFLQHPGTLISKDELIASIWNDTAVTDNALAQCIAEIRRELNDNSHNPRFIKTFPKIGYRFVAAVEVSHNCSVSSRPEARAVAIIAAAATTQEETDKPFEVSAVSRSSEIFSSGRLLTCAWLGLLLTMFAVGLFFSRYDGRLHHPGSVKAVTISAPNTPTLAVFLLRNETGRRDLDWLREGFSDMVMTDLSHTVKWKVLSRENVHALLEDGGRSQAIQVDKALDVARSIHAAAFVTGAVTAIGPQIHINIETRDGEDGHLIATDEATFGDPRQIVAEANLLSADIARHLGFSDAATPPLADVMTSNVEAYRYYSVGVEKAEQFQNAQAIDYLKKAIEFDPHFAMAFARIGYVYAVRDFQPENGRPYLERALHLSGQLPELNQLYIKAWYAIARTDYDAATRILEQITHQYPSETEAYCQLVRLLRGQEKTEEAAATLKNAIQNNPNSGDLYNAYGLILSATGRLQEATGAYKQYVALEPQNPNSHDSLGMAYQQAGQYEAAVSEYSEALKLDPEFEPSIVHLGDAYYQQGRYYDALREYRRYIQVTHCNDAKALGYGNLAAVYLTMGKLADAQASADQELHYDHTAVWSSLVIALAKGQKQRTADLERALYADLPNSERGSPRDMRTEFFYHGYIELKSGDSQGALNHFKAALQHLPPSSGMDLHEDCLANTYLELGMYPEAISEYQRILKLNPNYPLVYLHLGRAYEALHDKQSAANAFQHFLQTNPSADQDSPQILEAKHGLET